MPAINIRAAALLIAVAFAVGAAAGEDPEQSFDITDVHPSPPASPWTESAMRAPDLVARSSPIRGGRFELHAATLVDLISTAYSIDPTRIVGGPTWLDTARFDVIAKAPPEANAASLPAMLRSLLASRFRLVTHPDTRAFPEFALSVSGRPLLKGSQGAADPGCKRANPSAEPAIKCQGITIAQFVETLPQLAPDYFQNSKLLDRTSLNGAYDFDLQWAPRNRLATAGASGVSLPAALDKQLGLKIELRDVPEPVVVVDKAEPVPTPNAPEVAKLLPPMTLAFEVATIKPTLPGLAPKSVRYERGGRMNLEAFTLKELVKYAWDVEDTDAIDNDELLAGLPSFAATTRYDIAAVAPSTAPVDFDSFKMMLRALLVNRFGLTTHVETRTVSVLALTASRPRLQRATPRSRSGCRLVPPLLQSAMASVPVFNLQCRNITMAQLAAKLQAIGGPYVPYPAVDATGLTGGYDFTLHWNPPHLVLDSTSSDPGGGFSITEALDKQLGIRLKTDKRPMPVTIVDHLNPTPTAN